MTAEPRVVTGADPARTGRLERGARLARALASELCRTPSGNDDCGALHGIWPLLRRLGLAAEPARHAEFYRRELGALAVAGTAPRVLVAGSADWGMLELIAQVYRDHDAPLDATVVDRCAVPALLNAWFGAEIGLAVRTAAADLISYADRRQFDVICTHSILAYPPAPARAELVANWRRLLRPGGAVVTVSRLSTAQTPSGPAPDARQRAVAFGTEVLARADRAGIAQGLDKDLNDDPDDLRRRAERFSLAQVHHPVGDAAALRALFEGQGFEVTVLDQRTIAAAAGVAQSVVGAARSGIYGEIVAIKR